MNIWVEAARPKTLIAGITPVIYGLLPALPHPNLAVLFCLLGAALSFQIAANYANDYYDAKQGADTHRIGPRRLTAAGLVAPTAMKRALFFSLALGNLFALALIPRGGFYPPLIGLFFSYAAIAYTRGKHSLAYRGLGEVAVFLLFGLLGTNVAALLLTGKPALLLSLIPGALSTALLLLNNLRDIETDRAAGKKTLAVRFGPLFSKLLYIACIALAATIPFFIKPYAALASLALLPALPIIGGLLASDDPRPLGDYFVKTARMQLTYTLLFALTYYFPF